jgi:ribosomal protein L12E/L44/L45/RPP1/RPP2
MAVSRPAAERMLALAHDLAARLPRTARALHEGVIDVYKAQLIAEATRVLDDAAAAAAEAAIFGAEVEGRTPGQLRAAAGRAVLQADPAAARRRREEAQKDARVELWREDAGTAALCGFGLPPDEALAADQRIRDRTAELKAAGVPGGMDQLRVRAYLDALLGQDTAAATRAATAAAAAAAAGGQHGQHGADGAGGQHGADGRDGAAGAGPDARGPQEPRDPRQARPGTGSGPAGGTPGPAAGPAGTGPAAPRTGPARPPADRRLARAPDRRLAPAPGRRLARAPGRGWRRRSI